MKRKASSEVSSPSTTAQETSDEFSARPGKALKKALVHNQNLVIGWLRQRYFLGSSGCTAKAELFDDYLDMCRQEGVEATSNSAFGKLVRIAFPGIQSSRKGPRGAAKHQYKYLQRVTEHHQPLRGGVVPAVAATTTSLYGTTAMAAVQVSQLPPRTRRMPANWAHADQAENESESEATTDDDYVDEEYVDSEETVMLHTTVGPSASPVHSPSPRKRSRTQSNARSQEDERGFCFAPASSVSSSSAPSPSASSSSPVSSEADCSEPLSSSPTHAAFSYDRPAAPSFTYTTPTVYHSSSPVLSSEVIDEGLAFYPAFHSYQAPQQQQMFPYPVYQLQSSSVADLSSYDSYPTCFAQNAASVWEGDDVEALLTLTQEVDDFGLLHRLDAQQCEAETALLWQSEGAVAGRGEDWIDQLLLGGCN